MIYWIIHLSFWFFLKHFYECFYLFLSLGKLSQYNVRVRFFLFSKLKNLNMVYVFSKWRHKYKCHIYTYILTSVHLLENFWCIMKKKCYKKSIHNFTFKYYTRFFCNIFPIKFVWSVYGALTLRGGCPGGAARARARFFRPPARPQ